MSLKVNPNCQTETKYLAIHGSLFSLLSGFYWTGQGARVLTPGYSLHLSHHYRLLGWVLLKKSVDLRAQPFPDTEHIALHLFLGCMRAKGENLEVVITTYSKPPTKFTTPTPTKKYQTYLGLGAHNFKFSPWGAQTDVSMNSRPAWTTQWVPGQTLSQ